MPFLTQFFHHPLSPFSYYHHRGELISHFQHCGAATGIVIFDEVQKVVPGTLDVLLPILSERGGLRETVGSTDDSTGGRYWETSQLIFIFVSDIGSDRMIKLLLQHGSRDTIPRSTLRTEVKAALDDQWAGSSLSASSMTSTDPVKIGKIIDEVVPFLPMEQEHIEEVLSMKITELEHAHQGQWWDAVVVDDDVVRHLAGPTYIKYVKYEAKSRKNNTPTTAEIGLDGSSSGRTSGTTSVTSTSKIVARYGARALEVGGPLSDLRALLYAHMQPWRPLQTVHIGLVDNERHTHEVKIHGVSGSSNTHGRSGTTEMQSLYFQWCTVTHVTSQISSDGTKTDYHSIPESIAFSDKCETTYVGALFG